MANKIVIQQSGTSNEDDSADFLIVIIPINVTSAINNENNVIFIIFDHNTPPWMSINKRNENAVEKRNQVWANMEWQQCTFILQHQITSFPFSNYSDSLTWAVEWSIDMLLYAFLASKHRETLCRTNDGAYCHNNIKVNIVQVTQTPHVLPVLFDCLSLGWFDFTSSLPFPTTHLIKFHRINENKLILICDQG